MSCARIPGGIICIGGPTLRLAVKGKLFHFEMNPFLGPWVMTPKTGMVADPQPPDNSPFWEAVSFWAQQGRQMDADGVCLWSPPQVPKLVHLGGKHYAEEGSALAKRYSSNAPP